MSQTARIVAITAIVVSAMILSATAAFSQYDSRGMSMEKMWNIKAGLFFPQGNTVDSSELTVGIEHEHPASELIPGMSGKLSLTVDWTQITTHKSGGGTDDATLVPIFINWKVHYPLADEKDWYAGVGAGAYWAMDDIPDMRMDKGAKFAWQLMLGYHLTPTWFVEGRYMASSHAGDSGMFGAEVGYSF